MGSLRAATEEVGRDLYCATALPLRQIRKEIAEETIRRLSGIFAGNAEVQNTLRNTSKDFFVGRTRKCRKPSGAECVCVWAELENRTRTCKFQHFQESRT